MSFTESIAAGRAFALAPYDALYVPRDSEVEVRPAGEGCDLLRGVRVADRELEGREARGSAAGGGPRRRAA